jgi:hypothetical protein
MSTTPPQPDLNDPPKSTIEERKKKGNRSKNLKTMRD